MAAPRRADDDRAEDSPAFGPSGPRTSVVGRGQPTARAALWGRAVTGHWYRPAMFGLTVVLLGVAAVVGWLAYSKADSLGRVGADLSLYVNATRGALDGSSFYPAHQLAGPYLIADGDILYPPTAIPLFVPFLVLPAVLFWLVPLGIVGTVILRYRPAPWTWPIMALCLAYPPTMIKLIHGNPFMWVAAAVALGTVYGWPAVFAMLKPTLAPFALIGIRSRHWWIAAFGLALVSLPFAGLWVQYLTVTLDSRNPAGLLYSLTDVPLLLVPIVAWLGWSARVSISIPRLSGSRRLRLESPDRH